MRLLQLTPGTGHFYCGNCLRDHALVTALRRLGHDALLVPLYLPFHLEEPPLPRDEPVMMGGINLFLQHKAPWLRRLPRWMTGWLDSPRILRWSSMKGDMTDAARHAGMTLSMLRGEDGRQRWELERLILHLRELPVPDVVGLCNALLIGMAAPIKRALERPVVCTLQGEDAFLDALPEPIRGQAWETLARRAESIDAFIAVSRYYADVMIARLSLDPSRVHVVHNGIDLAGFEVPAPREFHASPTIGYLARLCDQKGLASLVEAFIAVSRMRGMENVRLKAAGVMLRADRPYVNDLSRRVGAAGLADRVEFLPNLDRARKIEFLHSIDVFSVPATYGEAFGLYLLEAMAAGVPVVQPDHGSFPEIIEATGGGRLCAPSDPDALASALAGMLGNAESARAIGRRGREAVLRGFTSEVMARRVADTCMMAMTGRDATSPPPFSPS